MCPYKEDTTYGQMYQKRSSEFAAYSPRAEIALETKRIGGKWMTLLLTFFIFLGIPYIDVYPIV